MLIPEIMREWYHWATWTLWLFCFPFFCLSKKNEPYDCSKQRSSSSWGSNRLGKFYHFANHQKHEKKNGQQKLMQTHNSVK